MMLCLMTPPHLALQRGHARIRHLHYPQDLLARFWQQRAMPLRPTHVHVVPRLKFHKLGQVAPPPDGGIPQRVTVLGDALG
jgi:hypothetical protein